MNGKITLLNVGDGDAIIVSLDKNDDNLIMVIDGGEHRHYQEKVRPALRTLLEEKGKKGPDIVVATHYDRDHIGGLIPLIDEFIDEIKEVWVHRSPELNQKVNSILESKLNGGHMKSHEEFIFEHQLIIQNPSIKEEAIRTKSKILIESLGDLETFLGKIPSDKVKHVYHDYSFSDWPEVRVLGPTEDFYNELFPQTKTLEELVIEETVDFMNEGIANELKRFNILTVHLDNPCKILKNDTTAKLTPTNRASIIIAIDNADKRFLFTGDAGISSFKAIPDWKTELANLYWLKIPHHGSDNNISTEIVNVMKPYYADNSGDRHQDDHVLGCIEKNNRWIGPLRSTKNGNDLNIVI